MVLNYIDESSERTCVDTNIFYQDSSCPFAVFILEHIQIFGCTNYLILSPTPILSSSWAKPLGNIAIRYHLIRFTLMESPLGPSIFTNNNWHFHILAGEETDSSLYYKGTISICFRLEIKTISVRVTQSYNSFFENKYN